jgi:predicted enzyme related to lactoylglutathione lyase
MELDSYEDSVPNWVDLGTPDPARAIEFYGALFGWEAEAGPPEAGGYVIAQLRGRAVAGIGPQQAPGPPFWTTYVKVSDAAATVARAKVNGGQVFVEPMDVMGLGMMAVLADPLGAPISLWQPATFPGAGIVNEPGTYSWSELVTTDIVKSTTFYEAVFGWNVASHGEGPSAYHEWKIGESSVGGMMLKPPTMPAEVPPFWGVYFMVTDTDKAVARVNELGGSTIVPPMDIEPGRFAAVQDPTGAMFSVITMSEPA